MENENAACGVCFIPYDTRQHTPFVLISCGHTLCSSCLLKIINSPHLRKCPFDNGMFYEWQNSLEHFPINFALLAFLESKNQNVCPIHSDELLTIFCLQDKIKICRECAIFGEHKGHPLKKITELKAQGVKTRKELEESLVKFEKFQQEEMEQKRKEFVTKIRSHFEEIKKIMSAKESEWTNKLDNLLKRNISNDSRLLLKKEASKAIEEIGQACHRGENLAILNRDFSSIISKLQPQVAKEHVSKLSSETSRMMDCLESFLMDQANSINNFDFSSGRVNSEQSVLTQQLSLDNQIEAKQNFPIIQAETLLMLGMQGESLFIYIKHPNPTDLMVDLGELSKVKRVKVELERYHSLLPESTDLNFLSAVLHQLNNYTSLVVVFTPLGLNDHHAIHLFDHLFCRAQYLTDIDISFGYGYFGEYKVTDKSIEFFCIDILSKSISLKSLTLKLGSTLITDKSLFALAKSLSPLSKNLESFTLGVGNTAITDDGIKKIFHVILGVKVLDLYLKGTGVTDRSLKALGDNVVPFMKNLERFILDASEMKITIEGVNAVFGGIPERIRWLSLDFSQVKLPDRVVSLFEENVCKRLKEVEDVYLRLEGTDLEVKVGKILETMRKNAEKRKEAANKMRVRKLLCL